MLQEISPRRLDNRFYRPDAQGDSLIFVFRGNDVLCSIQNGALSFPNYALLMESILRMVYLFSVDDTRCFLAEIDETAPLPEGFGFDSVRAHRKMQPKYRVYAQMTAWHLYIWYRDNQFCGRCGHATLHDEALRMLKCPDCGNMIFPKICPAVIVGVVDGDRILLTKYSNRAYQHFALIAGFTEIGETAEETVQREVFEEVGLKVKNIRYWNTQPWGVDTDLLIGYFAEADGDPEIRIDRSELSLAGWYHRNEMDIPADDVSLTNDMIRAFIENRHPH